jgi:hypothetical protein
MWRRCIFLAIISICVASITSGRGPADKPDDGDQDAVRFVKVGAYHLNVHNIDYTRREGDSVVVVFRGQSQLKLTGADANQFDVWVRSRLDTPLNGQSGFRGGLGGGTIDGPFIQPNTPSTAQYGNEGFRNYRKRMDAERAKTVVPERHGSPE